MTLYHRKNKRQLAKSMLPSIASTFEKLIKLDGGCPIRGVQPVKNALSASDGNRVSVILPIAKVKTKFYILA